MVVEEHVHCDDCGRELSPEEAKHEWGKCLCTECCELRDQDSGKVMPYVAAPGEQKKAA